MDNILEPWAAQLLRDVRAIEPAAHIAGGYLRDRITGKPVKDVDLFVRDRGDASNQRLLTVLARTHPYLSNTIPAHYLGAEDGVTFIYECLPAAMPTRLPEVNVITMNRGYEMHENVHRFDFGICQVATDGEHLIKTPAFEQDRAEMTFTLVQCENEAEYERSLRRWERLKVKYPGWRLVTPGWEHMRLEEAA
jgi:hypothetical protein